MVSVASMSRACLPRRWRPLEFPRLPRDLLGYLLVAEIAAIGWTILAFRDSHLHRAELISFAILAAFFAVFEQISPRIERLRIRMTDSHTIDMTSVWTFAGVIALPAALSSTLVILICLVTSRARLRGGKRPHRQVFSAASMMLGALAGSMLFHAPRPHIPYLADGALEAVAVALALAAYTVLNTSMVAGAMYLAARPLPVRALFGTGEENALELATLCLGGMTALALMYKPWLSFLVIVPLVLLQRGALIKQLEIAATTDPKTGLLNAVAWRHIAQKELSRAERDRRASAILIMDMDNFKSVNDSHGHLVGDAVLQAVADCLVDQLRDYDSVGRFGGEEFVAILPEVDLEMARAITDRVLSSVRILEVQTPQGSTVTVSGFSASIGVALYPANGGDVEALLHVADSALYAAKSAGRDRVEFVGLAD